MNRRNRSVLRSVMSSPLVMVAAFVLCVLLLRAAVGMARRASLADARLEQAQAQYGKLVEGQADLSAKVASLSTPDGLEADLRDKYHAVQPGESVAVIMDDSQGSAPAAAIAANAGASSAPTSTPPVRQGWWSRFWGFFGL